MSRHSSRPLARPARHDDVTATNHLADSAGSPSVSGASRGSGVARVAMALLVVASLGLLGACGGSDDTAATSDDSANSSGSDSSGSDPSGDQDGSGGAQSPDPSTVADCLADAGYETETSSEMLSEAQLEDQRTLFGQTESLTFDAATNSFAGGVSFYETPDQAAERAENLADAAKELVVVGTALISVEAGSDFDDAVDAAQSCLEA